VVLLGEKGVNQEADALAKHALDKKPNANFYIRDKDPSDVTSGSNWIKDLMSGNVVLAPGGDFDFERD
jgi:hypothetical protein